MITDQALKDLDHKHRTGQGYPTSINNCQSALSFAREDIRYVIAEYVRLKKLNASHLGTIRLIEKENDKLLREKRQFKAAN